MNARFNFVLVAMLLTVTACGSKKNDPPPEETRESMLTLKEQTMEECPVLTGTYSCPGSNKEPAGPLVLIIKPISSTASHVTFSTGEVSGFFEYMLAKYMLDDGGLIVNGAIHDKTLAIREALVGILNSIQNPIFRRAAKELGIDFEKEIKADSLKSLKAGYVSSCQAKKIKLHYMMDDFGMKVSIAGNTDGSVTATGFIMEHGGPIVKSTETCTFVSSQAKLPESPIDLMKKETVGAVVKGFNLDLPSTMNFELVDRERLVIKEPIYLRFDRAGMITGRTTYKFEKAFLGETDEFWSDDVDLASEYKDISINSETMKVTATINGQRVTIGDAIVEGKRYRIDLDVKQSYSGQVLTLKKK